MSRVANKTSRLQEIEILLAQHPEGMTQTEIAKRLGVDRSTISRNLRDLEAPIYEDNGRLHLDRKGYLLNLRLSLHEALSLHLASRLLTANLDRQNAHAASALRKISQAMQQLSPQLSRHISASADAIDELASFDNPTYMRVLETLTEGWAIGRKVQVRHRKTVDDPLVTYLFSPYYIEPGAWGRSTYAIGLREPPGSMRTFKVERIEAAELTPHPYAIPTDFDPFRLLSDAWGIWYTEEEPVTVVLKFSSHVAGRVQETHWHPSQKIDLQTDGSLIWRAQVAALQEMLPWIRGWGADVEVLDPVGLRNELIGEARKIAQIYAVTTPVEIPSYFHLWAKSEKAHERDTHALIYHLVDVGECALALWKYVLSEQTKQSFARWLNLDVDAAGQQLAFWAALHDLGKASPAFQRKYAPALPKLKMAGYSFGEESPHPAPHGVVSAWALKKLLVEEMGMEKWPAAQISSVLGGHHGAWPTPDAFLPANFKSWERGDDAIWMDARKGLLATLRAVYQPEDLVSLPSNPNELNALLTLLSGFVSVADWIGSMTEFFPFRNEFMSAPEYVRNCACGQAKTALDILGWTGWQAGGELPSFERMFPEISQPNAIQQETILAAANVTLPALVILEAPTGIGKTEAALFLADTWLERQRGKGIYIAMPSQATSNQMYDRVTKFLRGRYPADDLNLHLVHGAALLRKEETPQPQGVAQDEASQAGGVSAESWFLPRKRTLLAPFGVGTVDQALMSVLQTNHFFVRLFGLAQKVVVFDEVHAYDTYMSTLFERLLGWLHAIGTSVVLLSATLPEQTRQAFVDAWLGEQTALANPVEYPRLTVASAGSVAVTPLTPPPQRVLHLDWVSIAPETIADQLALKLEAGGCAAVICNRVLRAQEVYQAVQKKGIVEPDNLILFHARFPFARRAEIEERVLSLFGKNGDRPRKAIVVATQVIEQSLDLDFDYMISDLAPVDLLLQRAGRLHRHKTHDAARPQGLRSPCLSIARPAEVDGLPQFGLDELIYDKAVLLCTWLALQKSEEISLPEQTTQLIEAVYGSIDADGAMENMAGSLRQAREKARIARAKEIHQAEQRLINLPQDEDLLLRHNEGLEEDNPLVHETFRAQTRLGDPTVSLLCLYQTDQGIALEPDGSGAPCDIQHRPTTAEARQLLMRAVSVQRKDVVHYFLSNDPRTAEWKRSAAVRDHYPIVFDCNGEYQPVGANFILRLSHEFGLEVLYKEAK